MCDQVVTSFFRKGCLTRYCFRKFREVVYDYQYMIISRFYHADYLVVYLHDLIEHCAFHRLEWELHLPRVLHLKTRQACIDPFSASFLHSRPIKLVKYDSLLHFLYSLMSHFIMRPICIAPPSDTAAVV